LRLEGGLGLLPFSDFAVVSFSLVFPTDVPWPNSLFFVIY